jgi:hypothetical protein
MFKKRKEHGNIKVPCPETFCFLNDEDVKENDGFS